MTSRERAETSDLDEAEDEGDEDEGEEDDFISTPLLRFEWLTFPMATETSIALADLPDGHTYVVIPPNPDLGTETIACRRLDGAIGREEISRCIHDLLAGGFPGGSIPTTFAIVSPSLVAIDEVRSGLWACCDNPDENTDYGVRWRWWDFLNELRDADKERMALVSSLSPSDEDKRWILDTYLAQAG